VQVAEATQSEVQTAELVVVLEDATLLVEEPGEVATLELVLLVELEVVVV